MSARKTATSLESLLRVGDVNALTLHDAHVAGHGAVDFHVAWVGGAFACIRPLLTPLV